jgi:hypothetical protein
MEPPANVTNPAPAAGVNVPPQVFVNVAGVATTMFAGATGNVSVKATPVIADGVPLVIVNVSVLVCPSCTGFGLNIFEIPGTPTERTALALVPLPALVVVTAPVLLV